MHTLRVIRTGAGALAAAALLLCSAAATAQEVYSSRTVTVIVPYASISRSRDPVIRLLLVALSDKLGHQFFVETSGGANGVIGINAVAKAKPDGYTLTFTNLSPSTVLPFIQKDVP